MQIRKKYKDIKPELLFDELKDLIAKQGAIIGDSKMETYSLPNDSSSFISRGTLTSKIQTEPDKPAGACIQGHIVGSARGETKLLLDIDDSLFSSDKVASLQNDLDFLLGSYEIKE
ncbi:MAG: hypothetical protein ABH934_02055 [Chloroflexota bacterium]